MDVISFSEASTANGRIETFNANPDSTSGIVTVPKVIASGETITIPAGRVAVLPNVQVDGTIDIQGEVFVPSGSTYGDLDTQIATKASTTYVDAQVATRNRIVQGTVVNSTSGTSIDFTGIPSWAKKITVMFNGVSTSGASVVQVQLGSTTIQTTGYQSISGYGGSAGQYVVLTSGFPTEGTNAALATVKRFGCMSLDNLTNNIWCETTNVYCDTYVANNFGSGSVTLSGVLDRIRITTVNGTDTFDAGQINIMYEG